MVGRVPPRWSVVGTVTPVIVVLPAPRAGLVVESAIVWVGPPLLASVPSPALMSLMMRFELAFVRPPSPRFRSR